MGVEIGDEFHQSHRGDAHQQGHQRPAHHRDAAHQHAHRGHHKQTAHGTTRQLSPITRIENAETKGQHAAHEIITIAVHGLALGWQQQLHCHANHHQAHHHFPRTATHQQAKNEIALQHEPEKPVGTWPDDVVGMG